MYYRQMFVNRKTCFMQKISKYLLLFLLLGIVNSHASSAQTIKNIFDAETPVVYLGIDFTKKVLLTERLLGNGGGFGFRNYWTKSIEELLNKIQTSKYAEWKKKYGA